MISLKGKGVSAGVAMGPLHYYKRAAAVIRRGQSGDAAAEWERFKTAQKKAIGQLAMLRDKARAEAGEEAVLLFETHQMMVRDNDYVKTIESLIKEDKLNAEAAVSDAADRFADMFARMDDVYMQERAVDVKDVSGRIINILTGAERRGFDSPVPVVLAAKDLTPSETMQMDKSKILALVTEGGSSSSHTVILARTMGIPAVIAVGSRLKPEYEGCACIVDGDSGSVFLDADEAVTAEMTAKREQHLIRRKQLEQLKGQPNATRDGHGVKVSCSIGAPEDVPMVLANDGDGIGLLRSEFLYLNCTDHPSEDEQFEAYKKVLSDMDGREVVIRTLDIGADKQIGCFNMPEEENPALGNRALRLCLSRPEIFRTQLRALYRASAFGRLCIMFPMVANVWELVEARKMCEEVRKELAEEGKAFADDVKTGIMIETPAAALISDKLARLVDFFSCGTNDLTQYTLACDRQNEDLDRFFDPHHPAVLRLLKMVCDNAHKNGVWVSICGELGADLALTETFLSIGIDELSVSPNSVLPLREKIRGITLGDVKEKRIAELLSDDL